MARFGLTRAMRSLRILTAVALLGAPLTFHVATAGASALTAFEIDDGNIVDAGQPAPPAPTVEPYDWESLFATSGGVVVSTGVGDFETTSFIADGVSSDDLPSPPCDPNKTGDLTVLVSSGSDKNGDPIDTLVFDSGSVPQKDDITNVYSAAKLDGADTIFYFALERSDSSGDAHVDFEFLRAPIGLEVTGEDSSGCPTGHWVGTRTEGDILVSMDFTNGGLLGTPEIRVWVGDDQTGSYVLQTGLPAGTVGFFSNDAPIACGDWDCRDGSGATVNTIDTRGFVEGYVNIAAVLGTTAVGCYSTFNAKTRTSQSWDSELKDFALGDFNTCDASITLTPSGVNAAGTTHTFTATVRTNATGVMQPAPGELVTGTITGEGAFVPPGADSCVTGADGTCTLTITSAQPGVSTVNVTTTVNNSGTIITRSTALDSGPGGSGPATKNWVDDYIKVTADDVNVIDDDHTFVVEYGVLTGGATGLSAATPTITPSVSPALAGYALGSDCATPTLASPLVWRCEVTVNSSVAAVYTVTATGTTTVTMTGTPTPSPATAVVSASTTPAAHGAGGNDGATKRYVNARIRITPDGLNEADNPNTPAPEDPHTVTATVQVQDGSATWSPAPAGTVVTFTVSGVGSFVGGTNTTTCPTDAAGTCSVQLSSSVVGTSTVSATASPVVRGLTVTRTTATAANTAADGSGNVTKKWADASIVIVDDAVNEVTDNHTFTITVTPDPGAGVTVGNVSIVPSLDPSTVTVEQTTCSADVAALADGTHVCTITINSSTAGVFDVDATAVIDLTWGGFSLSLERSTDSGSYPGPDGNQGATKTYVDARVSVGDDGTNAVGDPHTVTGHAELHDGSPAGAAGWQDAAGQTITFTITAGPGAFSNGLGTMTCESGADGTCSVTMVSLVPGVTWVSASTSYPVPDANGPVLFRSTATGGSMTSNDLRKEWVAATITITPNAVNEVGDAHVFDIVVTATADSSSITIGTPTHTVVPATDSAALVCGDQTTTPAGATRSCTLTVNDVDAGVYTATALATVTIGGEVLHLVTDGVGSNAPPAVKTYVDARITLADDGVNEVGDPHPVTAFVEVDDGNGWDPAAGATVELTEDGPGTIPASCTTAADGRCTVTLTSAAAGVSTVHATVTVTVLGEPVTRVTSTSVNDRAGGGDDLVKRWVDGAISITPSAVNPVGASHTFTITAGATTSGAGDATFAITPTVTPTPDSLVSTCATPIVAAGTATCTVVINHNTPGLFTANASVVITVGGVQLTRNTDPNDLITAGTGGSGSATKRYVNADIQVTPDGVNEVGDTHVVTGHVNVDNGLGLGATNAPAGTVITFTVVSGPGALSAPTCATVDATGSCTVSLDSAAAGVTVVGASSAVTIDGVTISVGTNGTGANSDDLVKRWIDGFITITPLDAQNPLNEAHVFTIVATAIPSGAAPVSFDSITTTVTPAPGTQATTCTNVVVSGLTATCELTINSAVAGVFVATATATMTAGGTTIVRSTDATVAPAGPGGSVSARKEYVPPPPPAARVLGEVFERTPLAPLAAALARTGADVIRALLLGFGMLAMGAIVLVGARRSRVGSSQSHR